MAEFGRVVRACPFACAFAFIHALDRCRVKLGRSAGKQIKKACMQQALIGREGRFGVGC